MKRLILIGFVSFIVVGNANQASARTTPALKRCLWYSSKSFNRAASKCGRLKSTGLRNRCRRNALRRAARSDRRCVKVSARVQRKKRVRCLSKVARSYKQKLRRSRRFRSYRARSSSQRSARNNYKWGRKRCLVAYR